jgi:hypothetical protein
MIKGAMFALGATLNWSTSARTMPTSRAVPISSSRNGPAAFE